MAAIILQNHFAIERKPYDTGIKLILHLMQGFAVKLAKS